ncbi:TapY2 family type IVa secretion system protein [Thalassotalea sp. PLHSN55]|uniref:TapY2 family type IVa secretion system protein n=1 Tax=Thalassotalea sp. PLHSN55 TaxID=3435888 RepID=UPI003F843DCA
MKMIFKWCLIFSLVSFNAAAMAKQSTNAANNDNQKVSVKCYVELVGGGETISFWKIKSKNVSQLKTAIVGQKVHVAGKKQKAQIYNGIECVLVEKEFSNARAKALDKATPR